MIPALDPVRLDALSYTDIAAKAIYDNGPGIGGDTEDGWNAQSDNYKFRCRAIAHIVIASLPDTTLAMLARIAELEAGLRPFAEFIPDLFDDGHQDDDVVSLTSYHGNLDLTLTVADFRRAAALLPKASVREERGHE